jgi:hypothetical protein
MLSNAMGAAQMMYSGVTPLSDYDCGGGFFNENMTSVADVLAKNHWRYL